MNSSLCVFVVACYDLCAMGAVIFRDFRGVRSRRIRAAIRCLDSPDRFWSAPVRMPVQVREPG